MELYFKISEFSILLGNFSNFFLNFYEFKIDLFNLKLIYYHTSYMAKSGASDHAINCDRRSSPKRGDMAQSYSSANHFLNNLISPVDLRSYNG